jgi:protein-tyrosine phosphatase
MINIPEMSASGAELAPTADLHCHILPDWDDGPPTLEDSLRLAQKAADLGIRQVLATPHVGRSFGDRPEPASRDIAVAVSALQEQLTQADIAIELIPGAELTLSSVDFVQRIIDEPWLTFGAGPRYLLVESPFPYWPEWADQVLFELSLQNITPIIAHPERLSDVQKDVQILQSLVSRGALLQITARSLISSQRSHKECSRRLLRSGMVSIVASDAHSARHPMSYEIRAEIESVVGWAAARQILVENPQAILSGTALPTPAPIESQRKSGWLGFLSRRTS